MAFILIAAGCANKRPSLPPPANANSDGTAPATAAPKYDLLLRNGRVIDGSGNPWFYGDVAISNGRIAALGSLPDAQAERVIDATGLIVAPGFIDVHTHADEDVYRIPLAENFIRDGVTTIVTGNCGGSVRDVGAYFARIDKRTTLNVATLIGHNTTLRAVKGDKAGDLTPEQMEQARQIVRQAMLDGAVGLSTGLIYIPGQWSSTEEIIELNKVCSEFGGIYASHMRNEGGEILAAIDEALRIGRDGGTRVQISHFKLPTDVARRIGGSDTTLKRVADARAAGQEVWIDQYPYTASSTSLTTLIPDSILQGGGDAARKLLGTPQGLEQAMKAMHHSHVVGRGRKHFGYAIIASCRAFPQYNGKSILEVAQIRKATQNGAAELLTSATQPSGAGHVTMEDQYRTIIDLYLNGGAQMVFHSMDETEVANIMRHPLVAIASDSGIRAFGTGVPHPRGYGTNARVLGHYVRDKNLLPLQEAIRKMTSMPALAFRFNDRGLLRPGYAADVVLFDPNTVTDKATFEQPHQYAEGFTHVIVNGQVVMEAGKMTGATPGGPLYGPGWDGKSKMPQPPPNPNP
ncbi:MAG TPA: D-aminoacylase [Tepidisphaeraceae bacterium]|nr:D-aminoacylase [Tepidisphaeraceae bacterium]